MRVVFYNTNKGKNMKHKEVEHVMIDASINSEIMVEGCLHILDMAVQALADLEDVNYIRGSLYHCRLLLQLLLPDDEERDECK